MPRLVMLLLIVPILATARAVEDTPREGDLPRLRVLTDGLYRGGQPTEKGFQFLKERGVKTVINLRAEDDSEAAIVEKLGMRYVRIPVDEVRPWSQLPPGAIGKYFELVNNRENYPVYFHCRRGADRAGAFAALYRIAVQGWSAQKAYEEARDIGMRWYFLGLRWQIYDFHPPALTELQPSMKKQ
jgi:tyrosine-protein phosphatase SIW14